jgi:2-oxoglutarate-Fe(II)-dependent oxygenase superfamily protein
MSVPASDDTLINLPALRATRLRSTPWRWCVLPRVFRAGLDALVSGFPEAGFTRYSRTDHQKPYLMYSRPLIRRGEHRGEFGDDLAPVWARLADELQHPSYLDALGAMCGRDLAGLDMEATFWRYEAGCWLAPHPDKPEKVVSQVFYFNPRWEPDWGGALRILRSSTMDDVDTEVPPVAGSAVVIERSERSWHAVTAVTSTEAPARLSLQIAYYEPSAAR